MGRQSIVTGTGFDNDDGSSRKKIILKYITEGARAYLKRDPGNKYDKNAISVLIETPRLFGLLGKSNKQIGFIEANTAENLAKMMDNGFKIEAYVSSYHAPKKKEQPRISLTLEY